MDGRRGNSNSPIPPNPNSTTTTTTTSTSNNGPPRTTTSTQGPGYTTTSRHGSTQVTTTHAPTYMTTTSSRDFLPQQQPLQTHQSAQSLAPPPNQQRFPSPGPSMHSTHPATPSAEPDTGNDYFDTEALDRNRSNVSNRSGGRSRLAPRGEMARQPSIRLRRLSSSSSRPSSGYFGDSVTAPEEYYDDRGRPRSLSQPERARLAQDVAGGTLGRQGRRAPDMALPRLTEEGGRPTLQDMGMSSYGHSSPLSPSVSMPERGALAGGTDAIDHDPEQADPSQPQRSRARRLWPGFGRRRNNQQNGPPLDPQQAAHAQAEAEYDEALVDWLDTIDPEVQTLSTLTNVQNSLFIPDLGSWINRRPTYTLSQHQADAFAARPGSSGKDRTELGRRTTVGSTLGPLDESQAIDNFDTDATAPQLQRTSTITSRLTESHYAALPPGQSLEGWTREEKDELDDHVRHMLHSRRSRWKRRFKGFGQYVRRPLGFLVTLYATLITLFGLSWVLFLIGWIYVGDKQDYVVHIIDSVLVALFAIMGDGLAPFRAVDTWRMAHIVHYTRIIEKAKQGKLPRPRSRLQKRNIPPEVRESMDLAAATSNPGRVSLHLAPGLSGGRDSRNEIAASHEAFPQFDENDPRYRGSQMGDLEDGKTDASDDEEDWLSVLTPKQRKKFLHHKKKLAKSHSFYKPQETYTHYAFPLKYLIAIVVLLDLHSCLQISLGATTWGIDYKTRPFAITTVILCVSITCNVTAGIVISRGDKKTRKKEVVRLLDRQEMTGDAIKEIEKKRKKQEEEEEEARQEKEGGNGSGSGSGEGMFVGNGTEGGVPQQPTTNMRVSEEQKGEKTQGLGWTTGDVAGEIDKERLRLLKKKEKREEKLRREYEAQNRSGSGSGNNTDSDGSGSGVKKLVKKAL